MRASYKKYILNFKQPSGTSRGIITQKETWFLILEKDKKKAIGECGILRGLSIDDTPDYEQKLQWVCANIHLGKTALWDLLIDYPSIQFGVEMAFLSLQSVNPFTLFPSAFTTQQKSIAINGLVWMGDLQFMQQQIQQKIANGFGCIKLKIGALDFDAELQLIQQLRQQFTKQQLQIRVDANGAFIPSQALDKLQQLALYDLHSIEQPIKQNNRQDMAYLCKNTNLPIALDEELIGVFTLPEKEFLLTTIKPQYIVLKPSLIGGFKGTDQWIALAQKHNIGWWITSALESNIGLNAIAQFTFLKNSTMPQGLGTGELFTNNFDSPLQVQKGALWYHNNKAWNTTLLQ